MAENPHITDARNRLIERVLAVRLARSIPNIDGRSYVADALAELTDDDLSVIAGCAATHHKDPAGTALAVGTVVVRAIRTHAVKRIGSHAIAAEARYLESKEATLEH